MIGKRHKNNILKTIIIIFATSFVLCSCASGDSSIIIPCISSPAEFSKVVADTLSARNYLLDSAAIGFARAYKWFDDGTSARKAMISLRYDSADKKAYMTVITTISFRGNESAVNYTETKGFPGAFRSDFYPLLYSLKSYCNTTLPKKKKHKSTVR